MLRNQAKTAKENFTLSIPVRPAVYKYLHDKQLLSETGEFKLTKKGPVGRMLYHILRSPQTDRQYVIDVQQYSQTVNVLISDTMGWLKGCRFLTEQGIHDFNRQIEDLIQEEFMAMVLMLHRLGFQAEIKKVAVLFMDEYGFTDEDFTPESLTKAYYRRRKSRENKVVPTLLVIPNCPPVLVALNTAVRA